jgi:hypothetical protein
MLENHLGAATISGPTSHQVFVEVDHSNVRNDNPSDKVHGRGFTQTAGAVDTEKFILLNGKRDIRVVSKTMRDFAKHSIVLILLYRRMLSFSLCSGNEQCIRVEIHSFYLGSPLAKYSNRALRKFTRPDVL